ncbi:MAG: hypothetical protein HQK65_23830 [Desulfamplus sp.]|nr:hypothetical protein [Desulfamplus sp.]
MLESSKYQLKNLVEMGMGVLDGATVRAALSVITRSKQKKGNYSFNWNQRFNKLPKRLI